VLVFDKMPCGGFADLLSLWDMLECSCVTLCTEERAQTGVSYKAIHIEQHGTCAAA